MVTEKLNLFVIFLVFFGFFLVFFLRNFLRTQVQLTGGCRFPLLEIRTPRTTTSCDRPATAAEGHVRTRRPRPHPPHRAAFLQFRLRIKFKFRNSKRRGQRHRATDQATAAAGHVHVARAHQLMARQIKSTTFARPALFYHNQL